MSRSIVFFPAVAFLAYFGLSVYLLNSGHLHEDAYILYIFSESLARGNGISYFQGGMPAEGATDFLWMAVLGALNFAGMDTAIAAAILNGMGLSIITVIAMLIAHEKIEERLLVFFGIIITLIVISSQIANASLAGFSTGFYCSFVAMIFYILYSRRVSLLILLPILSILIGLIRPDGVIIGVVSSLIGMYFAYQSGLTKKYLACSVACVAVGLLYFLWRYSYFGLPLPLPLYVKGASSSLLPGLKPNIDWASKNKYLGIVALLALIPPSGRWKIVLASTPIVMLFISLIFATQSQNVAFRFQGPGTTLLILWLSICLPEIMKYRKLNKIYYRASLLAGLILSYAIISYASKTAGMTDYLKNTDYINYFPYHFAKSFDEDTVIALTEAGRFAYWVKGKKYDLVGLNTPEVAVRKSSPDYIKRINPDIIFIHLAGVVDDSNMCVSSYCEVTGSKILDLTKNIADWRLETDRVARAPLTVLDFYRLNATEYRVFAVRYGKNYSHMYFIKNNGRINVRDFKESLDLSLSKDGRLSYLEMKRQGAAKE